FSAIERLSDKKISFSESRYAAKLIGNERGHYLDIGEDAPVLHDTEQANFLRSNEPENNAPRIKTLSLFFIDSIKSYRDDEGWLK
ncbi:hypothetical protein MJN85_31405, partial [Salmonella enterica subsp. enterica serovar Anatum]|nr:hypothetical protein [Salmonella enterica subsp. enterica serovar Anatum]